MQKLREYKQVRVLVSPINCPIKIGLGETNPNANCASCIYQEGLYQAVTANDRKLNEFEVLCGYNYLKDKSSFLSAHFRLLPSPQDY